MVLKGIRTSRLKFKNSATVHRFHILISKYKYEAVSMCIVSSNGSDKIWAETRHICLW